MLPHGDLVSEDIERIWPIASQHLDDIPDLEVEEEIEDEQDREERSLGHRDSVTLCKGTLQTAKLFIFLYRSRVKPHLLHTSLIAYITYCIKILKIIKFKGCMQPHLLHIEIANQIFLICVTSIFIGLFQVHWHCNVKRVRGVQYVKYSNRLYNQRHIAHVSHFCGMIDIICNKCEVGLPMRFTVMSSFRNLHCCPRITGERLCMLPIGNASQDCSSTYSRTFLR